MINVLVSAVHKISKYSKLGDGKKLYRGMGGDVELPEHVYKPDMKTGVRCITDWGFMSTTANKEIAIQYSGAVEEKPVPTILEIETNAVDRGASLKEFSQYPKEEEFLWLPCSYLSASDKPKYFEIFDSSIIDVIPVRMNANLKARTIEEHLGTKKGMHLSSLKCIIAEIENELEEVAKLHDLDHQILKYQENIIIKSERNGCC